MNLFYSSLHYITNGESLPHCVKQIGDTNSSQEHMSQFVPCLINEKYYYPFDCIYILLPVSFTNELLYREQTAMFAPVVCFHQLYVQSSLRHHHALGWLGGAKRVSKREGWRDEGGGIAAGITELQNPQRDTHRYREREIVAISKQHHSLLDGTSVNRIEKRTEYRDRTSISQKDKDEVD